MSTYYGVWSGHTTGVYDNWSECQKQISGFKGAQYKKLTSKNYEDALKEFKNGYQTSPKKEKNTSKKMKKEDFILPEGIVFFSDGSCPINSKEAEASPTGSGIALYENKRFVSGFYGSYHDKGTNNTGEINAALFCLKYIRKHKLKNVSIFLDSQYVINSLTKWAFSWEKNQWRKSDNKEIENIELIKKAFDIYKIIKNDVTINHVNSHVGIEGNEIADRLAYYAILKKEAKWGKYDNLDINEILGIS